MAKKKVAPRAVTKYVAVVYTDNPMLDDSKLASFVGEDKFEVWARAVKSCAAWSTPSRNYRVLVGTLTQEIAPKPPEFKVTPIKRKVSLITRVDKRALRRATAADRQWNGMQDQP